MRLKCTGRLLTALAVAGLGTMGAMDSATAAPQAQPAPASTQASTAQPAPAPTSSASRPPASPGQTPRWELVEDYCVKCHNTSDWAGGVAFDTMSADAVPKTPRSGKPPSRNSEAA